MNKKSYILLQGGLGNQMFQYAFYLAQKQKNPKVKCDSSIVKIKNEHNGYELYNVFKIKTEASALTYVFTKILNRLKSNKNITRLISIFLKITLIKDSIPSEYKPEILVTKTRNYYLGYWQSEKYFKNISETIRTAFTFDVTKLSQESRQTAQEIQNTNSISIHIRRGDYLLDKYQKLYGGICTLDYYTKAINHMLKNFPDCKFFIFSDDIKWVEENLCNLIHNKTFIDFNKGKNSWQDMYLMSICKHNIIANSSFSWWAAWLNLNKNKIVISPNKFLNIGDSKDLIPEDWIKIK